MKSVAYKIMKSVAYIIKTVIIEYRLSPNRSSQFKKECHVMFGQIVWKHARRSVVETRLVAQPIWILSTPTPIIIIVCAQLHINPNAHQNPLLLHYRHFYAYNCLVMSYCISYLLGNLWITTLISGHLKWCKSWRSIFITSHRNNHH